MSDPVLYVVTESFGGRGARPVAGEGYEQAASTASSVTGEVSSILSQLASNGATSLTAAMAAVNALSSFKPHTVAVNYALPEYTQATLIDVPEPNIGDLQTEIDAGENPKFSYNYQQVAIPEYNVDFSVSVDDIVVLPERSNIISALPTAYEPTIPVVPEAPGVEMRTAPSLSLPALPALEKIEAISVNVPLLPTFQMADAPTAPAVPLVVSGVSLTRYEPEEDLGAAIARLMNGESATFFDAEDASFKLGGLTDYWTSRGQPVPVSTIEAVLRIGGELDGLQHNSVRAENAVSTAKFAAQLMQLAVSQGTELQSIRVAYHIGFAKAMLDAAKLSVEAHLHTASAMVALYNARLSELNIALDIYRTEILAAMLPLRQWEVELTVGKAMSAVNEQQARNYAMQQRGEAQAVELYKAAVAAAHAQVRQYQGAVEAVKAKAEFARLRVSAYTNRVEAYAAEVEVNKAHFARYSASMQGIAAENSAKEARLRVRDAGVNLLGIKADAESINVSALLDKLKADISYKTAGYSEAKALSAIEGVKVSAVADSARLKELKYSARLKAGSAQNDALADQAAATAQYYSSASDAAFKAAEVMMRVINSSSQATLSAFESAGRTAASLAQGAYSAVHVNASLSGTGAVSGSFSKSDSDRVSFSDTLSRSETVTIER